MLSIRAPVSVEPGMRALMLSLLVVTGLAHAAPTAIVVARTAGASHATTGPIEARFGEAVELFPAVRVGRRWYADVPIRRRKVRPLAELGEVRVSWRLVEPRPHHVDTAPPNPGNPAYSNNVLFGPDHGKWLGYDTIEYIETPVRDGPSLTVDRARPSFKQLAANRGLGTVRYAVSVGFGDQIARSPGMEATGRGGISPKVFRLSFRPGDGLLGYLQSYFNVPNVFGSAGRGRRHQTELHQGADCADVIIGAARKAGADVAYTSVAGMAKYTRRLTDRLYFDGQVFRTLTDDGPGDPVILRWGEDIQPGDIMLIKYARFDFTGRTWDHIGVLEADAGEPGVLDPKDPLLHIAYLHGLGRQPIASQGVMVVQFTRFRDGISKRWR